MIGNPNRLGAIFQSMWKLAHSGERVLFDMWHLEFVSTSYLHWCLHDRVKRQETLVDCHRAHLLLGYSDGVDGEHTLLVLYGLERIEEIEVQNVEIRASGGLLLHANVSSTLASLFSNDIV